MLCCLRTVRAVREDAAAMLPLQIAAAPEQAPCPSLCLGLRKFGEFGQTSLQTWLNSSGIRLRLPGGVPLAHIDVVVYTGQIAVRYLYFRHIGRLIIDQIVDKRVGEPLPSMRIDDALKATADLSVVYAC